MDQSGLNKWNDGQVNSSLDQLERSDERDDKRKTIL
jgi:hypothetical protein